MFASHHERVHQRIVAAKAAELEHVRRQIDALRAPCTTNDHAATRLHGLLAYEKRIADAQEWPFDQTTLVRVGASALYPDRAVVRPGASCNIWSSIWAAG